MGTTNILDLNNRVDELEKSYPASHVMLSDGVTSVEDKIGNMRMSKLWENPDPSASFASQTITMDSTGFDLIAIIFKNTNTTDSMATAIALNGHTALMISAFDVIYSRAFNTTNKSFTDGYKGSTVENNVVVPYQIYGIKLT